MVERITLWGMLSMLKEPCLTLKSCSSLQITKASGLVCKFSSINIHAVKSYLLICLKFPSKCWSKWFEKSSSICIIMYPMFKLYGFLLEIDLPKKRLCKLPNWHPAFEPNRDTCLYTVYVKSTSIYTEYLYHTLTVLLIHIYKIIYFHMNDIISHNLP